MSATYSNDPGSSALDWVRFTIGDRDTTSPLYTDEEIHSLLAVPYTPLEVAVQLAYGMASRHTIQADMSVGDLRISYSQLASAYGKLATRLAAQLGLLTAAPIPRPYAAGISVGDVDSNTDNTDNRLPTFYRGMMENR